MDKFLYKRMVKEFSKESKEELVQRIMALQEIECKDRAFANQCQSGTAIYDINELFSALDDLTNDFTYEKTEAMHELINNAKCSWDFIKNSIVEINDNSRTYTVLENIKERIKEGDD